MIYIIDISNLMLTLPFEISQMFGARVSTYIQGVAFPVGGLFNAFFSGREIYLFNASEPCKKVLLEGYELNYYVLYTTFCLREI